MRALVVSNMLPDDAVPERGRFVRDQVQALRRLEGIEVELYEFAPGPRELTRAVAHLRRQFATTRTPAATGARLRRRSPAFDVVHAHFGLTAWPAAAVPAHVHALTLHGTDVNHPRTLLLTLAALPFIDVLGTVSSSLAQELPLRSARRRAQVLPCGVDVERFQPIPRAQARSQLGLDASRTYVLFPADPSRTEKRHDRAVALCAAAGSELLTLGGIDPLSVPLWVNAANAVLVPSEREGFGLAVLEALACDVPVLATPVGVHAEALDGVEGALCAPFDLLRWRSALEPHLRAPDPRVHGRAHALAFSAAEMAARVAGAWRAALQRSG
ncbi:MAG: glycosyl transferase group 1 [Solirubrobacterales bacterium]|nr:glycosyl transferase group 1 [Solirubrobacterales bacterium]